MKSIDYIVDGIMMSFVITFMIALGLLISMGIGYVLLAIPIVYLLLGLCVIFLAIAGLLIYAEWHYNAHLEERGENEDDSEPSDYL